MNDYSGHPHDLLEILNLATDAVIVISENHTILSSSQSAEQTFGYSFDEYPAAVDQAASRLRCEAGTEDSAIADEDVHFAHLADHIPALCLRRDGSEFPAEISVARMLEEGQRVLVVATRDVSSTPAARKRCATARSAIAPSSPRCQGHCDAGCDRAHRRVQRQRRAHPGTHPRPNDGFDFAGSTVAGRLTKLVLRLPVRSIRSVHTAHRPAHVGCCDVRPQAGWTRSWVTPLTPSRYSLRSNQAALSGRFLRRHQPSKTDGVGSPESEARYRALFVNTIDAVLLTAPDGSIFAMNPEACRLLGRTEEEICRPGRWAREPYGSPGC